MAKLTARKRRELAKTEKDKKENFAIPEKAPGSGSYPINDKAHARAALSRGKQHLSEKKLKQVKQRVKAKYPDMKIKGI